MFELAKKFWPWLCVGLFVTLIGLAIFSYKERSTYQCVNCLSRKHEFQWFVGCWAGLAAPVSAERIVVEESFTLKDFLPTNHVHNWAFAQGSPYYFGGTKWGGCALGAGRIRNDFAELYEGLEDFRKFIAAKVNAGQVARNEVYDLILSPRKVEEHQADDIQLTARLELRENLRHEFLKFLKQE